MRSQSSKEGVLLIDHTFSPGLPADIALASGMDPALVAEGTRYESATFTCSHCTGTVVFGPKRTRAPNYCASCSHFICDGCLVLARRPNYVHRPFVQLADEVSGLHRPATLGLVSMYQSTPKPLLIIP